MGAIAEKNAFQKLVSAFRLTLTFEVEFCDDHELEYGAMSIPNTRPRERRPIRPGEILREEFLPE